MLTAFPTLVGLDGRKMSKSYGNTIPISGTEDDTKALVMKMFTDPTRLRRNDPGHPENCPVFSYHKIFNTPSRLTEIEANCKDASLGCVDCKKECGALVATHLAPIRDTRQRLAMDMDYLSDVLSTGAKKAKAVASQTLLAVKDTIGL
jgi:tryptophanyl-tRNA synthetase